MIYWLFENYFANAGLGLRIGGAGALSFVLVILLGPRLIRFLIRKKIGDRPEFDHADLNEITRHKSATPTMGGSLIVIAIFVSLLLFGNLRNMYINSGLLALVWLGVLGGVDDWLKLRRNLTGGGRDGLKSWEKFVFQVGLAVLLSVYVYRYGSASYLGPGFNPAHRFFFPVTNASVHLPILAYTLIMILVTTGSSNAVNLTDGMDGLAAGNLILVTAFFLIVSWIVGVVRWAALFNLQFVPFSAEMTVLCSAMLGALLGFLWYNAPPAAVFMGDTGSLPLGGLIGYIAVVTRQELLLLLVGGVFVMEVLSVVLQVGYFKLTKGDGMEGRRLFRCAPIHHHFHLGGWPETKVVIRFWILGVILAVLALGTLKLR
ncbi:MAG: phospho-N-acetylmuramoyl-pentapeptide-transferase [Phycisphaerae bacterium]|nr:phospho-N-acetylmuramoyl-pentapeptide-transferase [Phycisphaerae bacterium]